MNTEKARSELIIAPILMEAIRLARPPVSLFSGAAFDVDKEQGLNGAVTIRSLVPPSDISLASHW